MTKAKKKGGVLAESLKRTSKKVSKRKAKAKKEPISTQLPDLDPVLDAYLDAYAIVHTASHAIHNGDGDDKAVATATLRQGVKAFDAANDRLEAANMQLSRYCRKGSKS